MPCCPQGLLLLIAAQRMPCCLQRMLLLSYDKAAKRIQLRHYSVTAQPSGVSKGVKALVGQRALPNMGHVQDVSEFLSKSGYGSVGFPHTHLCTHACIHACSQLWPSLGMSASKGNGLCCEPCPACARLLEHEWPLLTGSLIGRSCRHMHLRNKLQCWWVVKSLESPV